MTDQLERLVAEIPDDLKALVDADDRTNREVVESALWREFGGERLTAIERRIEEKQRRASMIQTEKNERERELKEKQQEIRALERKLETKKESKSSRLADAEEKLSDTPRDPENPAIKKWAKKLDMEPSTLIEKLEEEDC